MISIFDIRYHWMMMRNPPATDIAVFDACMKYREMCLNLPEEDWRAVIDVMFFVYPGCGKLLTEVYYAVPESVVTCLKFRQVVLTPNSYRGVVGTFEDDDWFSDVLIRHYKAVIGENSL